MLEWHDAGSAWISARGTGVESAPTSDSSIRADQRGADACARGLLRSARARRTGGRSRVPSRRRGRWASTPSSGRRPPDADEVLGRLGGVFYGTVVEYIAGPRAVRRRRVVAAARRRSARSDGARGQLPDGRPGCRLHVQQTGFEDTPRWRRYYAVIAPRLALVARRAEGVRGDRMSESHVRQTRASSRRSASATSSS